MTVFLAICALLIRTLVLRVIRLARIAESVLAFVMSGSLALGTETVRTRVRVPALSCRDTYRAACVLVMIRLARIAENALARHMSGCMALGTNAVWTRVRVARVSRRDAYRAILWATLVSCHMCSRATVSADHASNSTFLSFSFLTAAAVTDPADNLPAVFRDPGDGLSAAFLRPRCWTPDGRTGRAAMD
jgi:hypothetical protein